MADSAYSNSRSGVRWAETTRTSLDTPSWSSVSLARRMVSQSERDPMMMPTSIVIRKVYHHCCSPAHALQRCPNRLGIDAAHQFADELLLAAECTTGLDASSILYRCEQVVVEIHRQEIRLLNRQQLQESKHFGFYVQKVSMVKLEVENCDLGFLQLVAEAQGFEVDAH